MFAAPSAALSAIPPTSTGRHAAHPAPQARARAVQAKQAAGAEGAFLETKRNTYDVVFVSANEPFRLVLSDIRARLQKTKCVGRSGARGVG